MGDGTPIWNIEGVALDSTGDMVADSLADHVINSETDVSSILDEVNKIDNAAVDGFAGVDDSLAYKISEIERHYHSYESWFGLATVPNGEIHRADRIGTGVLSFQIDAGNLAWGTWVCVLGSSDTPARGSNEKYDLHRFLVVAAERTTATYFVQFAFGATGADALAAGTYTEVVYYSPASVSRSAPTDMRSRRIAAGTKAWARCLCQGQNTGTLNFYLGLHGYEG